jgi:hypothetical protein
MSSELTLNACLVEEEQKTPELSLDADIENDNINLISKEGKSFSITKKQASLSELFSTTLTNDPTETEIELNEISDSILSFIVEFLIHYNGEKPPMPEKPARSSDMKENTTEWNANFIDTVSINKKDLYSLISAANYIHCESLLHLACCKVAAMIKNIPLSEIKKTLDDSDSKEE